MDLALPRPDLDLDPADVHDEYARRGLERLTDAQLFASAAAAVSRPKREPATSFLLHAPLELMARRALLPLVPPDRREAVRERMVWVAAKYERAAEPADPASQPAFEAAPDAVSALLGAVRDHDLDGVDGAACWLARYASTDDVMGLAGSLIDSLAAAGHGSIYFHLLARTAAPSRAALGLLRPLVHEIARLPELRIEWVHNWAPADAEARPSDATGLTRALASAPRLGLPGSDFIFPIVHQVDNGGVARDLVAAALPADASAAGKAILQVAALSMLQDDPAFAPYGWSHCLTLPQAVLGITPWITDAQTATAIAATYVVAFRASQGSHDLDVDWEPARPTVPLPEALRADPATAASATYYATGAELDAVTPELAASAAGHEDAHLAKYTLACLDAAAQDPLRRPLYLAAAAYLGAWWAGAA